MLTTFYSTKRFHRPLGFLFLIILLATSCATPTSVKTVYSEEVTPLGPYNGPKARIAIVKFENKTAKKENQKLSQGLADMLTSSLFNSNRYILLDRTDLDAVIAEQDFGITTGRVAAKSAIKLGEIYGADLLLFGAVTEYEPNHYSAGAIGTGLATFIGTLILSADNDSPVLGYVTYVQSHIAIDLKIVDATTGRVLYTGAVKGSNTKLTGGLMAGVGGGSSQTVLALGGSSNHGGELKAIRKAIDVATSDIVKNTPANFFRSKQMPQLKSNRAVFVPFTPVELSTTGKGNLYPKRSYTIIRSQTKLAELLKSLSLPPDAVSTINWNKSSVVAIFGGKQKSANWITGATKVVKNQDGLIISASTVEIPKPEDSDEDKEAEKKKKKSKKTKKQAKKVDQKLAEKDKQTNADSFKGSQYPFGLIVIDDRTTPVKKVSWF